MANNQKKLKAFVRYDGSGRVVASSLILRKNKPRVGRWYEIPEYLCCNGNPSSTTTTTTQGGGSTPTAWFTQVAFSGPSDTWKWRACNGSGLSTIVYTSSTTITAGTYLYLDAALTMPVDSPSAISFPSTGLVFDVVNGQTNPFGGNGVPCSSITTTTSTTTQGLFTINVYYQGGSSTSLLCPPGSTGNGSGTLYSNTPTIQAGSILYTSPGIPLTFGGFYYKEIGQNDVFYAPGDDGVAVQFTC